MTVPHHHHAHLVDPDYDDLHHGEEPGSDGMWLQDNVVLHSVGIDIGSATTQAAFSRLHLRRHATHLTSRYVVVERELVYDAGVSLTPFAQGGLIDAAALGEILDRAFAGSGWAAADIDTGAVILTGEALRRANASAIAHVVARQAGQLVCATAGHHMEALLAAYGSGAVRRSHDEGSVLLNVDIGGGTTKVTAIDRGKIVSTGAFLVGGRLVAVADGVVVRIEPGGARHAEASGFHWSVGDTVTRKQLRRVAETAADAVARALSGNARDLCLTEPPVLPARWDGLVLSGGVAAYVHGGITEDFGDLGPWLAAALAERISDGRIPGPLLAGEQAIRATVIGASEYTVQLSGITGYLSAPRTALPRRNLPVARVDVDLDAEVEADIVANAARRAAGQHEGAAAAFTLTWSGPPRYSRVAALARGLRAGLGARFDAGRVVYLLIDGDIALTLGRILAEELGVRSGLVVLDGIQLRDFDYVDLGNVRPVSGNVPITIKSLAFLPK